MNAIPILIDTFTLNVSWLMTAAFPHGESCFSWLTELPLVQSKVSFSDGNIVFIYTYFCHLQHTGRKNWKLKYLVSFSLLLSRRKPERRRGRGRHLFVNWRSVLVKNLSPFPSDVSHEVAAERGLWGEWWCARRTDVVSAQHLSCRPSPRRISRSRLPFSCSSARSGVGG